MIHTAAMPPPPAPLVLGAYVRASSVASLPARPRRPFPMAGEAPFHGGTLGCLGDGR